MFFFCRLQPKNIYKIDDKNKKNNNNNNPKNNQNWSSHEFVDLRKLLRRLWVRNAGGLQGRSPWLILSCVQEIDAFFAEHHSFGSETDHQDGGMQQHEKSTSDAITALIPECVRGLNVPRNAHAFAEPWSAVEARPEQVDRLEADLAQLDAQKLFQLLTLVTSATNAANTKKNTMIRSRGENGNDEDNKQRQQQKTYYSSNLMMMMSTHFSFANAVLYGALSRSLHRLNIHDAGMLLLLVSGPGIDNSKLKSRVEAASASHLIDALFVQALQWFDHHVKHPNHLCGKERSDSAVAAVRFLSALSHLSSRGFLLDKRHHHHDGGGGRFTPKSRVMSVRIDVGGAVAVPSHSPSSSTSAKQTTKLRFSRDRLVAHFVDALFATSTRTGTSLSSSSQQQQQSLIELLSPLVITGLERALHALGGLTVARTREIDRVRGLLGTESRIVARSMMISSGEQQDDSRATPTSNQEDVAPKKKKDATSAIAWLHRQQRLHR